MLTLSTKKQECEMKRVEVFLERLLFLGENQMDKGGEGIGFVGQRWNCYIEREVEGLLIVILINKTGMMTNTNFYTPKASQISSSSIFYPTSNNETKKSFMFPPSTSTFDNYAIKNDPKPEKHEDNRLQVFPKALASQSMIDINSTSTRRSAFGMLDSMARKVNPTFQEDTLHQLKKPTENTHLPNDNPTHSTLNAKLAMNKKFSSTLLGQQHPHINHEPHEIEVGPKKRRESIDLSGLRRQQNHDALPFMRRAKNPEDNKVEIHQEPATNGDGPKTKNNFEFLKKRRENAMNQQSTTASMIAPYQHNVQSMKNLGQFSNNNTNYKKPEFLSANQNSHTPPTFPNTLQSLHDKGKVLSTSKVEEEASSPIRNFEFKKKKPFESPIEPTSAKPFTLKQTAITPKREIFTMKQKLAMKNQREIKLEDFQLLQKLGKGAFGDVYIAQQKTIGFICVIKKMSKKRIKETKVQEHILREIKIQSYLNDPHLTSLFGYFHDQEYLYLILEALPDGSLQNVKKKKKLPEKEAAAIIKQVANGLKSMHEEYLIHRDLKPQNLFVNQNVIKIGDFGCSIYNRNLGLRNTIVGCLQYSSPEQLSKEGYSQKIDSWSLGIMTYELLFGKSPFGNDIIKLASNKEIKPELSSLSFPAGIPIKDETKNFIINLLEENPANRMDMDEVLRHPFLADEVSQKEMKYEQFLAKSLYQK